VTVGAGTRRNGVRSRERKSGGAVIEGRTRPAARAVALRTGLREIRRHVVRVRGGLEVLQVT
jgi:hypothetical protein